jgi:hypothetical protein
VQGSGDGLLGDGVVHPAIALAVSVDKAFVAVVDVLDAATSRTLEDDAGLPLYCLEFAIVDILPFYLKAFRFEFVCELLEVVSVILHILIPTNEVNGFLLVVFRYATLDKDVLEDAFRRYRHNWNVIKQTLVPAFHL